MEVKSLSQHADCLYRMAKCDPSEPPGPAILIERLLGDDSAEWAATGTRGTDARLMLRPNGWRVVVPRDLSGVALCMALGRVIARWYVLAHLSEESTPPPLDDLAIAILFPDAAVRRAIEAHGRDVETIASHMALPHGAVERRIDEVPLSNKSGFHILGRWRS